MGIFRSIFNFIIDVFQEDKHICPKCNIEATCYGSEPWGRFTYKCDKCGWQPYYHTFDLDDNN